MMHLHWYRTISLRPAAGLPSGWKGVEWRKRCRCGALRLRITGSF